MMDTIKYKAIAEDEDYHKCEMCGDKATIVYIPTGATLCLSCKLANDEIIYKRGEAT
jgi:hypothetical protein